jgi:hypothetical protein
MSYLVNVLVHYSTLYLIGVTSCLIGFPLVKLGNKWGKIFGSYEFNSRPVLFVGLVVSVLFMTILFDVATPFVSQLILKYVEWIPTLLAVSTLILYGWFCKSCDFNVVWAIIAVLVLVIVGNAAYLYFAGYFAQHIK